MNTRNCGYVEYVPEFREKIGWKLFPSNHFDAPEMEGAHDGIHSYTVASFSFLDRLRILISGKVEVTTKTATENLIGNHKTLSGVRVLAPKFLSRKNS